MHLTPGNRFNLFETGDEFFPALEAALDRAEKEIHLETYIFADDETGQRVAAALAAAARRGVIVRLLVDGFGSRDLVPGLRKLLVPAGVQIAIYRPTRTGFSLRIHHLRRLHRKLVVIDGVLAFCGGINLLADHQSNPQAPPRYDFAISIEGPLAADVHRAMRRLWLRVHVEIGGLRRVPVPAPFADGALACFLTRDNFRHRRHIENAYLSALASAKKDVLIACGYFLPGRRMRRALLAAAKRGVRVRLLLQGQPDHLQIHYATQTLYRFFLANGVLIYEYSAAHLHAKVALIDDDWATVGSSNIDPFSLWLSREANVVMRDHNIIARLRESLEEALTRQARPVTTEFARRLPLHQRLVGWTFYQLGRLIIGLSGLAARNEF